MLKNKKFILISSALVITAVFVALLFILFKPMQMNANEADAAKFAQTTDEISEVDDSKTDDTEMDNANPKEILEINDQTEDVDPRPNADDVPESENTVDEQSKYIGRQPPEGYVEPTYLDGMHPYYREDEEYIKQYNEENKKYIEQGVKFESNIVVMREGRNPEFEKDYEWFKYSPEDPLGNYFNDLMWTAYAILTYYDGNVPCDYYVTPDSVYNQAYVAPDAYLACEVQTYGERPLNIRLDKFNYRIRVEEGIKKEDRHIELSIWKLQLAINEEFFLKTEVISEHPEDHQIIWSSDDDTIATVSDDGMVKGIGEGVACLTVSTLSGELSKFVWVNVVAP